MHVHMGDSSGVMPKSGLALVRLGAECADSIKSRTTLPVAASCAGQRVGGTRGTVVTHRTDTSITCVVAAGWSGDVHTCKTTQNQLVH